MILFLGAARTEGALPLSALPKRLARRRFALYHFSAPLAATNSRCFISFRTHCTHLSRKITRNSSRINPLRTLAKTTEGRLRRTPNSLFYFPFIAPKSFRMCFYASFPRNQFRISIIRFTSGWIPPLGFIRSGALPWDPPEGHGAPGCSRRAGPRLPGSRRPGRRSLGPRR